MRMRDQRGFTLIEMVVFIVVLGVGITGTLAAIIHATRDAADPLVHLRAAELGQSYLDEIAATRYDTEEIRGVDTRSEACPSDRRDWLVLGCYEDLDDQPPQNALGDEVGGYANYRVTASVAAQTDWNGAQGRWVTVTVHAPNGTDIAFELFRGAN
ncbi:MAG: type IV pilus modification PilV family protein [Pseudomonadota bacterium]